MGATKRLAEIYLQSLSGNHWPLPLPRGTTAWGRSSCRAVWQCARLVRQRRADLQATDRGRRAGHGDASRNDALLHDDPRSSRPVCCRVPRKEEAVRFWWVDMVAADQIVDLARQLIELSPVSDRMRTLKSSRRDPSRRKTSGGNSHTTPRTSCPRVIPRSCALSARATPYALVQEQMVELEAGLLRSDAIELKLLLQGLVTEYRPAPSARRSRTAA